MRQVFSVLVDNRFGELPRIVGLCAGRGYELESVSASEMPGGAAMRIHITTRCDDRAAERLHRLLATQVRVLEVETLSAESHIERAVALATVRAGRAAVRDWLARTSLDLAVAVLSETEHTVTLEAVGDPAAIAGLADELDCLGPCDIALSGPLSLKRPEALVRRAS